MADPESGIQIGWATTLGQNVKALIEQAFDGLLSVGADGVDSLVRKTGQPWVWAEDESIGMARLDGALDDGRFGNAPRLFLETDPYVGLTMEHINQLRVFCETVAA